jgi:transcriptional regulator with PAS, ATPase and Fis domain
MPKLEWEKEIGAAVTVCDTSGIILYMNDKSAETFSEDGGRALLGTNLLDCHPEPAKSKLKEMLEKEESNIYTIEKNGTRKLIHQSPWYSNGEFAGLVEMVFVLPAEIPNHKRS